MDGAGRETVLPPVAGTREGDGKRRNMIKVWGQLWKNGKMTASETCESSKVDMSEALLECLEHFGHTFDMETPMWHTVHSKQLGGFQKAVFTQDDFIDRIPFDRFEMVLLERD